MDGWRVGVEVTQGGVNIMQYYGRVGADELGHRADAQWVNYENEECPGNPGKQPSAAAASRCGFLLRLVVHKECIGLYLVAVKGRND
jgi:hypothetical protein